MAWIDEEAQLEWVVTAAPLLVHAINGGKPIDISNIASDGAALRDLDIVGPALLFATGNYLVPIADIAKATIADSNNRDWQAAPLLRSLYEYAATFCWMVADSSGDRERAWAAEDKRIRLAIDIELTALGGPSLPREKTTAFKADVDAAKTAGLLPLDNVAERARLADDHWKEKIKGFGARDGGLKALYTGVYRYCSQVAHPSSMGLASNFVHGTSPSTFSVGISSSSSSRYFYTLAMSSCALAIQVGGEVYDWVDPLRADEAFATKPD